MTRVPPSQQAQDMLNRRLAVAVNSGRLPEARQLLSDGADPNFRQAWDEPLISFAAAFDTIEMVQLLIDHGADIHLCDKDGVTPLAAALESGHFDIATFFIQKGANINQQMVAGVSIPPFAAGIIADRNYNRTDRTEFVLKHAPDLDRCFTYNTKQNQTIFDALDQLLATASPRQRPVVVMLQDLLRAHQEQLHLARQEKRLNALRVKSQKALRKGHDGRFKL